MTTIIKLALLAGGLLTLGWVILIGSLCLWLLRSFAG
jgi:hypothetical protein